MEKCSFMDAAVAVNETDEADSKRWVLGEPLQFRASQDGPIVG